MTAHTPGPWIASPFGDCAYEVMAPDGTVIAVIDGAPGYTAVLEASARLIAAAPDLLESARRIVSGVHSEYRIHADADDDYIHDTIGTALSDAYFSARAAIAKAEGRS